MNAILVEHVAPGLVAGLGGGRGTSRRHSSSWVSGVVGHDYARLGPAHGQELPVRERPCRRPLAESTERMGRGQGELTVGRLATPEGSVPVSSQYSVSPRLTRKSIPRRERGPGQSGDTRRRGLMLGRLGGGSFMVRSGWSRPWSTRLYSGSGACWHAGVLGIVTDRCGQESLRGPKRGMRLIAHRQKGSFLLLYSRSTPSTSGSLPCRRRGRGWSCGRGACWRSRRA